MTIELRVATLEASIEYLTTEISRLTSCQPSASLHLNAIASRLGVKPTSASRAIARYNAEHIGAGLKPVGRGQYLIEDVRRLERWRQNRKRPGIGEQAWKGIGECRGN